MIKNIFEEALPFIELYRRLSKSSPMLGSVSQFSRLIQEQPTVKMNLQMALDNSQSTLPKTSIKTFVELINAAIQQPPAFTLFPLVGGPINTICSELMQTQNGRNFFSQKSINIAIRNMLMDYNKMLKSKQSLKYMNENEPDGWLSPLAQQYIDYSQFKCDPTLPHYGFSSWNDFFIRQFKPEARPVPKTEQKRMKNQIVSSCECFALDQPVMPIRGIKKSSQFWLKGHSYSLKDMFGAGFPQSQQYAGIFEGGTVFQGFLDAFLYHRWHSPVDGTIVDNYLVEGHYFVDQSQFTPPQIDSFRVCQPFLSAVAARRVIVIEADNQAIGKIALIYIGMADISSCISNLTKGEKVQKGQYIGHFQIGGSSHVVVFQNKANLSFSEDLYDKKGKPKLQKVNYLLAQLL